MEQNRLMKSWIQKVFEFTDSIINMRQGVFDKIYERPKNEDICKTKFNPSILFLDQDIPFRGLFEDCLQTMRQATTIHIK